MGNDIGCGMALFRTGLPAHFRVQDLWARRLTELESAIDDDAIGELGDEVREGRLA